MAQAAQQGLVQLEGEVALAAEQGLARVEARVEQVVEHAPCQCQILYLYALYIPIRNKTQAALGLAHSPQLPTRFPHDRHGKT